jgi:two-component system NarL family sensor kinase
VSIRNLSHQLYPATLLAVGLTTAIEGLIRDCSHASATITFTHERVPVILAPNLGLCVFRVVQELLQNALKHSRATIISVHLSGSESHSLHLTIADNGVGFVIEQEGRSGLGLISVGERVEAVGGSVNVWSRPHRGTTVTVSIPVPITETPVAR